MMPADFEKFQRHVEKAVAFLHPLVGEFRDHYLDKVSYCQRVDEVLNKNLDAKGDCDSANRSTQAWDALCNESDFPALRQLIAFGGLSAAELEGDEELWERTDLTQGYLLPLRCAIGVLVSCQTRSGHEFASGQVRRSGA